MKLGVGIDYGTSNSTAAIFDGHSVLLLELENDSAIMPSATYIDRDLQTRTGQGAIDQYIRDNTGRTVEMVPEVIGEVSEFTGDQGADQPAAVDTVTEKIYGAPVIDSGLLGRLFRGTKRLLGDERVRRLMVFDHPFRLVALITPILLRIRTALNAQESSIDYGHLGHPVHFEGRDGLGNELALSRLSEAYKYAGIKHQEFYPEPIAAAVSYLHANPEAKGDNLLTLDFGGGTLDFCIVQRLERDFKVLATHGIGLGGDHIDQLIYRQLLFPLLGQGERWRRRGMDREIETRFPFEEYEDLLLNWPVTYTLNQNRYTAPVQDCIAQGGAAAVKFRRLLDLIQQNLGYLVFQEIKEFKARLSSDDRAVLDIPELDIELSLTRQEFEILISDLLTKVDRALDKTLALAGIPAQDIDIVIRTGGSSLIPAVRHILEARFPSQVVEHDPFTSVAAGLAIASYRGYGLD